MKRCKWLVLLIAVLMLVGCSGGSKDKVTKAEGIDSCKPLVDEFYAGLAEADPVRMTTTYNGEVSSVFTKDGEKMLIEDSAYGSAFYLFKENGKAYYMAEGEKPMKEDVMYDMYAKSVEMNLTMFVTGIYTVEDTEGLEFNVTRTDKEDGTSELVSVVKGDTENGAAEITSTGVKADGKVSRITVQMKSGESTTEFVYDFEYDTTIDLPEHEIKDMTQYYHHIDSPYATVEDILGTLENEEDLNYMTYGDKILVFTEENGRQLELIAQLSDADFAEYENLDFFADDYQQQVLDIVRRQAFTDCVDFTDALIPQEQLDAYAGQKGTALLDDGFEESGFSASAEGGTLIFAKDDFEYEAEFTLPEGYDEEAELDFAKLCEDGEIQSVRFSGPGFGALPIE